MQYRHLDLTARPYTPQQYNLRQPTRDDLGQTLTMVDWRGGFYTGKLQVLVLDRVTQDPLQAIVLTKTGLWNLSRPRVVIPAPDPEDPP
jgi:hypothetical protein